MKTLVRDRATTGSALSRSNGAAPRNMLDGDAAALMTVINAMQTRVMVADLRRC